MTWDGFRPKGWAQLEVERINQPMQSQKTVIICTEIAEGRAPMRFIAQKRQQLRRNRVCDHDKSVVLDAQIALGWLSEIPVGEESPADVDQLPLLLSRTFEQRTLRTLVR